MDYGQRKNLNLGDLITALTRGMSRQFEARAQETLQMLEEHGGTED